MGRVLDATSAAFQEGLLFILGPLTTSALPSRLTCFPPENKARTFYLLQTQTQPSHLVLALPTLHRKRKRKKDHIFFKKETKKKKKTPRWLEPELWHEEGSQI
jgi:hypothetical protein